MRASENDKRLTHLLCVPRGVLKRKRTVPERQFCQKTACSSYVQPWLAAVGGWRLVAFGGWRLVVPWGGP